MSAYASAMERKLQALVEMDAFYARLIAKPLPSTRWYLHVSGELAAITVYEMSPGTQWRCVAAGTRDAMEAAARLLEQ